MLYNKPERRSIYPGVISVQVFHPFRTQCALLFVTYNIHVRHSTRDQALLPPQRIQMLDDREVRIQKPIHTVRRAGFLALIQLAAPNCARDAFLPADVREGMYRCDHSLASIQPRHDKTSFCIKRDDSGLGMQRSPVKRYW